MTEKLELYRCEICGNLVEVLTTGYGELYCCGEAMKLLTAHTEEEMKGESHLPIKVINEDGLEEVRVGAKPHPMLDEHHIEFIQTISQDGKTVVLQFLNPNDEPKMLVKDGLGDYIAREHCNIHGLWANIIKH